MQETVKTVGLIPGSGRSPAGGHGNPLQYSCLENPMGREACQVAVHGVTELYTTKATYQHSVIKTGWYQWRDKHISQWSRIDDPEMEKTNMPKDAKVTHWRKDMLYNT